VKDIGHGVSRVLVYNILSGYILFNNGHGYGVLEHLMRCKLEVAYNKYYLKHKTIVNHKPTFVMAKKDLILNNIEKK
jgi:hypothetical protein